MSGLPGVWVPVRQGPVRAVQGARHVWTLGVEHARRFQSLPSLRGQGVEVKETGNQQVRCR